MATADEEMLRLAASSMSTANGSEPNSPKAGGKEKKSKRAGTPKKTRGHLETDSRYVTQEQQAAAVGAMPVAVVVVPPAGGVLQEAPIAQQQQQGQPYPQQADVASVQTPVVPLQMDLAQNSSDDGGGGSPAGSATSTNVSAQTSDEEDGGWGAAAAAQSEAPQEYQPSPREVAAQQPDPMAEAAKWATEQHEAKTKKKKGKLPGSPLKGFRKKEDRF